MAKNIVWEFNIPKVGLDFYDREGEKISIGHDLNYKKIFDEFIENKKDCYLSLQDRSTYEFYDIPLSDLDGILNYFGYENGRPSISVTGNRELELTGSYKRKINKALKQNEICALTISGFGSNSLLLSFDGNEFPNGTLEGHVTVRYT